MELGQFLTIEIWRHLPSICEAQELGSKPITMSFSLNLQNREKHVITTKLTIGSRTERDKRHVDSRQGNMFEDEGGDDDDQGNR